MSKVNIKIIHDKRFGDLWFSHKASYTTKKEAELKKQLLKKKYYRYVRIRKISGIYQVWVNFSGTN